MSRRRAAEKRTINPDPKFGDLVLGKFTNCLLFAGKKSCAEIIVYGALDRIASKTGGDSLRAFHEALNTVKPDVEVKSRRVGGATYQVPNEVKADRAQALAIRWIVEAARKRSGKSMQNKLHQEFLDASDNKGGAVKKREDTHKMAEANKAFAHFRW